MTVAEGKVYTGGRDNRLFIWRGRPGVGETFNLEPDTPAPIVMNSSISSIKFDEVSKWLFVGLWDGTIKAYCKDPVIEDELTGHRRSVSSLAIHSSVLVS